MTKGKTDRQILAIGIVALAIVLITACAPSSSDTASGTPYQCDGGKSFVAEFSGEGEDASATLTMEGETLELPLVPAASGAKYSDGTTTLWTQGGEAFIEVNDEIVYQNCVAQ